MTTPEERVAVAADLLLEAGFEREANLLRDRGSHGRFIINDTIDYSTLVDHGSRVKVDPSGPVLQPPINEEGFDGGSIAEEVEISRRIVETLEQAAMSLELIGIPVQVEVFVTYLPLEDAHLFSWVKRSSNTESDWYRHLGPRGSSDKAAVTTYLVRPPDRSPSILRVQAMLADFSSARFLSTLPDFTLASSLFQGVLMDLWVGLSHQLVRPRYRGFRKEEEYGI